MNCTKIKKKSKINNKKVLFNGLQIEQCSIVPELRQKFKWTLKKYIGESGMNQNEVANKLGWYSSYLSLFLSGKGNFPFEDIEKICKLLGITIEEIFLS